MVEATWPFDNRINEDSKSYNSRMVGKLITRRDADPSEFYSEIGEMVRDNRMAQRLTMKQASTIMGIDVAFIGILESGSAFYSEVNQVWDRLEALNLIDKGYSRQFRIDLPF